MVQVAVLKSLTIKKKNKKRNLEKEKNKMHRQHVARQRVANDALTPSSEKKV